MSVYAWPPLVNPPAPIRQMIWLNSATTRQTYPPGTYGAAWGIEFQNDEGLEWWAKEMHKIADRLASNGVVIDFIQIDSEDAVNVLPAPYTHWEKVRNYFDTLAWIVRNAFPGVTISVYGDKYMVDEVSWTGQRTGEHLFFGWQARTPRAVSWPRNYVNQFWDQPWAPDKVGSMMHWTCIEHWIGEAKQWKQDGPPDASTGKGQWQQADREYENPAVQRAFGSLLAKAAVPVVLYADTWNAANLAAFAEGLNT